MRAHMPQTSLRNAVAYEEWIAEADGDFTWATFDENTACGMCYTSGTTGNPKGVVYSHRSNVLHSMMALTPDAFDLSVQDTIMPVVPFFHANGWTIAFSAPMSGCRLVLPGMKLDGVSIYELLEGERVTMTAAVPTIWLMLLAHMEANNLKLSTLRRVLIGGSACPRAMIEKFEKNYGVDRRACLGHDRDESDRLDLRASSRTMTRRISRRSSTSRRSRARRRSPSR